MARNMTDRSRLRDLTYMALMAALLGVCAWIALPLGPVVFTMQTFGVFAALGILGGRRGTLTFLLYLALGLAGLPVFSGFTAGIGILLGPTGGYLTGFLLSCLLFWGITARWGDSLRVLAAAMVLGLVACYAVGTAWFLLVYGGSDSLGGALALCVAPYLLPDLGKLILALAVTRRVRPHVKG